VDKKLTRNQQDVARQVERDLSKLDNDRKKNVELAEAECTRDVQKINREMLDKAKIISASFQKEIERNKTDKAIRLRSVEREYDDKLTEVHGRKRAELNKVESDFGARRVDRETLLKINVVTIDKNFTEQRAALKAKIPVIESEKSEVVHVEQAGAPNPGAGAAAS